MSTKRISMKQLANDLEKTLKSKSLEYIASWENITKEEVDLLRTYLEDYGIMKILMEGSNTHYEIYVSRPRSFQHA